MNTKQRNQSVSSVKSENLAKYRLYAIKTKNSIVYQIQIRYLQDVSTVCLQHQDRSRALFLYKMILQGNVTPVTLSDIVEDFDVL